MGNYILIIEDDTYFVDDLEYLIEDEFTDLKVVIYSQLSDFFENLDSIISNPPVTILIDLMMRIDFEKLDGYEIKYDHLDAGFLVLDELTKNESTSSVPTIIMSARERSTVDDKVKKYKQVVSYIQKPVSAKDFIEIVYSSLSLLDESKARKSEDTIGKVLSAFDAKPGAFGVSVDLKKLLKNKTKS